MVSGISRRYEMAEVGWFYGGENTPTFGSLKKKKEGVDISVFPPGPPRGLDFI